MMTTDPADSLNEQFVNVTNSLEHVVNDLEVCELSSDGESEISISEKIVLESNERRLRQRMTSLQTSILNLKEQLRMEKELWKEDMQKMRQLQQQQEVKCTCSRQTLSKESLKLEDPSRNSSIFSLGVTESNEKKINALLKTHSIKQLLELQNYKRKLAETETMCSLELSRVKQSLDDLKTLQSIATEWGKGGDAVVKNNLSSGDTQTIHEIYMNHTSTKNE